MWVAAVSSRLKMGLLSQHLKLSAYKQNCLDLVWSVAAELRGLR